MRARFDESDKPEKAEFYPIYRGDISEEHIDIQGVLVWHRQIKIVSEENETFNMIRNINTYYVENIDGAVIRVTFSQNDVYMVELYLETLNQHLKEQKVF